MQYTLLFDHFIQRRAQDLFYQGQFKPLSFYPPLLFYDAFIFTI